MAQFDGFVVANMNSFQINPSGAFPASQSAFRFVQYEPRVDPARQKNPDVHKPPANLLTNAIHPPLHSSRDPLTKSPRMGSEKPPYNGGRGNSISSDSAGDDGDLLRGLFSDDDGSDMANTDTALDPGEAFHWAGEANRNVPDGNSIPNPREPGGYAARTGDSQDMPILIDNDAATTRLVTVSPDISEGTTAGFYNNDRQSEEVDTSLHPARIPKYKREPLSPDGGTKVGCTEASESAGSNTRKRKRKGQKTFGRRDHPTERPSAPASPPVWRYKGLTNYQVRDGRSWVRVVWRPTWEPAEEFPPDEVAKAKRRRLENRAGDVRKKQAG